MLGDLGGPLYYESTRISCKSPLSYESTRISSSKNMNLGSISRRLDDDINQLQVIKASLIRKKDLERDIVRLRGEDDGRSQKSDSGAPSMILQSSVAAVMPGLVFQSNEVGIEASAIVGGE